MAQKKRIYQVGERIKTILAEQLLRTADPRFSLVTITAVMVSPDLRNAKVYWVVSLQTGQDREERHAEVQEALGAAEGLFKRILGSELGLRFVPALRFFYDDTFDTVEEVDRLFKKVKESEAGSR